MIGSNPAVGSVAMTALTNAKMAAEMKEERIAKVEERRANSTSVGYQRYKSYRDQILG